MKYKKFSVNSYIVDKNKNKIYDGDIVDVSYRLDGCGVITLTGHISNIEENMFDFLPLLSKEQKTCYFVGIEDVCKKK